MRGIISAQTSLYAWADSELYSRHVVGGVSLYENRSLSPPDEQYLDTQPLQECGDASKPS
jgi:hypothetical protein